LKRRAYVTGKSIAGAEFLRREDRQARDFPLDKNGLTGVML
jgi:hypothetical protein